MANRACQARRWTSGDVQRATQPFPVKPRLEVIQTVDAPVPIAAVAEHPGLVVPRALERSVVGFERRADRFAAQAPMTFDQLSKRLAVVPPDRLADLDRELRLLGRGTGLQKHGVRAA